MWLPISLNRPLVWVALAALPACIWLTDAMLRMVAASLVIFGLWDMWCQVRQQRQRYQLSQSAINLASDAIVVCDADNRIMAVNPAFTEITGYNSQEIVGRELETLADSSSR